ncbi:hypothetical protein B0I35DRAFT_444528 [Stachybotrys elegans]|uniref:Uncharacterized protein n=1 Tax=Stachybotrys elegans TaxID=80388 RepID=A0A8K0WL56_9HYPO|nr:hypothetical protein B0I35DRAFT_444528 [Stachybotrys elegans]
MDAQTRRLVHRESCPWHQFLAEVREERLWLQKLYGFPASCPEEQGLGWDVKAAAAVKVDWTLQGIWRNEWDLFGTDQELWRWKHEEKDSSFSFSPFEKQASRPFARFCNQVQKACERQLELMKRYTLPDGTILRLDLGSAMQFGQCLKVPANINTDASAEVRSRWIDRGIWDDAWGILPGMAWKHEEEPAVVNALPAAMPMVPSSSSGSSTTATFGQPLEQETPLPTAGQWCAGFPQSEFGVQDIQQQQQQHHHQEEEEEVPQQLTPQPVVSSALHGMTAFVSEDTPLQEQTPAASTAPTPGPGAWMQEYDQGVYR